MLDNTHSFLETGLHIYKNFLFLLFYTRFVNTFGGESGSEWIFDRTDWWIYSSGFRLRTCTDTFASLAFAYPAFYPWDENAICTFYLLGFWKLVVSSMIEHLWIHQQKKKKKKKILM
jgi:hypothetical protein